MVRLATVLGGPAGLDERIAMAVQEQIQDKEPKRESTVRPLARLSDT
jgi:hypothetical protein